MARSLEECRACLIVGMSGGGDDDDVDDVLCMVREQEDVGGCQAGGPIPYIACSFLLDIKYASNT